MVELLVGLNHEVTLVTLAKNAKDASMEDAHLVGLLEANITARPLRHTPSNNYEGYR